MPALWLCYSESMNTIVTEKVDQAVAILQELNVDCWLTFVRETTETGDPVLPLILGQAVTWQSAFILTRTGQRIAIVGKYEDEAVACTGAWPTIIPYVQSIRQPLLATLNQLAPKSIAVNYSQDDVKADGLSHGMMSLLQDYLKDTPHAQSLISASDIIRALRSRKTPGEVQRMREAIAVTDEIFELFISNLQPGMTEVDISRFMHGEVDRRGLDTAWERSHCPIVTTGPHSMIGHGVPSADLRVTPGSVVHLDFGVRMNDYCSDIQRGWYLPRPGQTQAPDDVLHGVQTVVNAISAAAEALKPGVECWTVDAAARQVMVDAGYPEYQHATGHNVGRAAHDGGGVLGPRWERYGRTPYYPVEAGNVYTLELGIDNLAGMGCFGLEEMVLVTDNGVQWLTQRQMDLPVLPTAF